MHDGNEEVRDLSKVFAKIGKLVEEAAECLEILVVLISLSAGGLDLLLKLAEGTSVG